MSKFRSILLPTDFSAHADFALEYAKEIANPCHESQGGAIIHLLHVLETSQYAQGFAVQVDAIEEQIWTEAEKKLREIEAALINQGFNVKATTRKGYPKEEIVQYASENEVDMIVMGTHGLRGLERILFGSTTEGVLRKATCPVLSVRTRHQ